MCGVLHTCHGIRAWMLLGVLPLPMQLVQVIAVVSDIHVSAILQETLRVPLAL